MPLSNSQISEYGRFALKVFQLGAQGKFFSTENPGIPEPVEDKYIQFLKERRIDSLFYFLSSQTGLQQKVYEKIWAIQRKCLEEVMALLVRQNISCLVFKGVEFITRFYHGYPIGLMRDLDILVPRTQLNSLKALLHSLGYKQAYFNDELTELVDLDVIEIGKIEISHYELVPFIRLFKLQLTEEELTFAKSCASPPLWVCGNEAWLTVELDIHHQVAIDIPSEPFFERAVPSALGFGHTMSDTDHLWFTLSRYYTEVALHHKRSLRDFAYLIPLLLSGKINWDLVVDTADQYNIHCSLFYYLYFLKKLTKTKMPEDKILSMLNPVKFRRDRDLGWQLAQLFEISISFPSGILEDL